MEISSNLVDEEIVVFHNDQPCELAAYVEKVRDIDE